MMSSTMRSVPDLKNAFPKPRGP